MLGHGPAQGGRSYRGKGRSVGPVAKVGGSGAAHCACSMPGTGQLGGEAAVLGRCRVAGICARPAQGSRQEAAATSAQAAVNPGLEHPRRMRCQPQQPT